MKKTILSLMLVLAFLPLVAQNHVDTIFTYFDHYQGRRDPTFYYYGGFDDWFRISRAAYGNTDGKKLGAGTNVNYVAKSILATYRYIDTSLRIIGVAAAMDINVEGSGYRYSDTTIAGRVPEYLQLYKPTADSMILLAQGCWNDVQPRYRLQIFTSQPYVMLYYPYIYEVYFDSAITVSDSFYVAGTEFNNHMDTNDYDKYAHPQTRLWQISYEDTGGPYTSSQTIERATFGRDTNWFRPISGGYRGEVTLPHRGYGLLIFPIFDTTGIVLDITQPTRLAEQHTTLYPNPATTEASLFSAFRIHTVEVYNTQGQLVENRKVEAQYARLNLAAYPKGMYVVVVTTAAGRTTKKLLVE